MVRLLAYAALVVLATPACGSQPKPDAAVAQNAALPPPSNPAPSAPDADPGPDLDGDGQADTFSVGAKTLQINGVFVEHHIVGTPLRPRVVDVDTHDKHKEIVISACDPEGEDDCAHYLFAFADHKIVASPPIPDTQADDVTFSGDGSFEISASNCGQTITTRYVWQKHLFQKKGVKKTGKRDPSQCFACPAVFVDGPSGPRLVGEILRDLRSPQAERLQRLRLPNAALRAGQVRLRLVERKPETTFLDAVYLRAGDRELRPLACSSLVRYCDRDDVYEVLEEGDELELIFDVAAAEGPFELWAEGYYLPHRR